MYRGKAFCEATIYLYSNPTTPKEELDRRIDLISKYQSATIKVTSVNLVSTRFDEQYTENVTLISVLAEVLVTYDPKITHLNDYRVKACTELRKQFPKSGAIMAHSIDTYYPPRIDGFI
ncbi:hypothetical protein [Halalkalibacterium ligniniphilum]|uniref:hypothetical protein n=1 Tax=Halalkalibacterium ligniniphilum TaxID=1134413 RepID=UPI000375D208|nr:hypothetical protein [Halalkalibacterium ligniniphilum]